MAIAVGFSALDLDAGGNRIFDFMAVAQRHRSGNSCRQQRGKPDALDFHFYGEARRSALYHVGKLVARRTPHVARVRERFFVITGFTSMSLPSFTST